MARDITRVVRSPSKGEQRVKLYGASDLHQIIRRLAVDSPRDHDLTVTVKRDPLPFVKMPRASDSNPTP